MQPCAASLHDTPAWHAPQGLYFGMFLAPLAMVAGLGTYIYRKVRWDQEAAAAHARMLAAHGGGAAAVVGASAATVVEEEFVVDP